MPQPTDVTIHPLTRDRLRRPRRTLPGGRRPEVVLVPVLPGARPRLVELDAPTTTASGSRSLTRDGPPPGLVGYRDGRAVGWVSLAPRPAYDRLTHAKVLAPVDDKPVWSIVCFVVSRSARGRVSRGAPRRRDRLRRRRRRDDPRGVPVGHRAAGRSPPRTPTTARCRCSRTPDSRSSRGASSTARRRSGRSSGATSVTSAGTNVVLRHLSYCRHRHSAGLTVVARRA